MNSGAGFLKVFDLSRREAKAHGPTKSLKTAIKGIESVTKVRANSAGSHVAIIVRKQVLSRVPLALMCLSMCRYHCQETVLCLSGDFFAFLPSLPTANKFIVECEFVCFCGHQRHETSLSFCGLRCHHRKKICSSLSAFVGMFLVGINV